VFLSSEKYKKIKKLGYKLDTPYSKLIREGVELVLKKYKDMGIQSHIEGL
jgi:hypothetical protein